MLSRRGSTVELQTVSDEQRTANKEQRASPGRTNDLRFARMMVGPAVAVLFLVTIAPLVFSLGVSFTNLQFSSPQPIRWVGIDNYFTLVTKDTRFQSALVRTLLFVLAGVATQTVIGYFIASLLS